MKKNLKYFDDELSRWWWLLTPWSTPANDYSTTNTVVSPSGYVNGVNYNNDFGVRPVCIFSSSIFESGNDD